MLIFRNNQLGQKHLSAHRSGSFVIAYSGFVWLIQTVRKADYSFLLLIMAVVLCDL